MYKKIRTLFNFEIYFLVPSVGKGRIKRATRNLTFLNDLIVIIMEIIFEIIF